MVTASATTGIPLATVTATALRAAQVLAAGNPNPTTPPFSDDVQWITAYLAVHMLSVPSRRYSYFLWFAIAFLVVILALLRFAGLSSGALGTYWYKWAIRRPIFRRGGKLPTHLWIFPSRAQLLSAFAILALAAIASCAGPDYIKPTTGTFNLARRSLEPRRYWDPLQFVGYAPQYTISKAWWTAGGRTGMIAYALFPLCVLFALKSPPFALFALPFTAGLHFDKLAFLHRWSGRLIWLLSTLHVIFWCMQLLKDRRTSAFAGSKSNAVRDKPLELAWSYIRFIYAWIAYGLLTLLQLFSIPWLRKRHYETFYFLHIILVPLTLVLAALHHPPIWWWCWVALGLWVCERIWRFVRWLRINGKLGSARTAAGPRRFSTEPLMSPPRRMSSLDAESALGAHTPTLADSVRFPLSTAATRSGQVRAPHEYPPSPPRSAFHAKSLSAASTDTFLTTGSKHAYVPPPGWAHAELLAGNTIRLTYSPPSPLLWAPGQHFLICVPAVTAFTTHPFTATSVADACAPVGASARTLVLLVRAKAGWTKDLWDEIAALVLGGRCHPAGERIPPGTVPPRRGTLMRMYVEGPFGSAARARWGEHATAVIVCGGSGVSFGLSILEYLCLCMAGREGRDLGVQASGWGRPGFRTTRVRFIWLVREYSHVQWCASALRRCLELIPPPGLQVDIFMTNSAPIAQTSRPQSIASTSSLASPISPSSPTASSATFVHTEVGSHLAPPVPRFARRGANGHSSGSDSERSDASSFDLSYYASAAGADDDDALSTTDFTNWDGDNDAALPGEHRLSRQVKQAGRHRRTLSRRLSQFSLKLGGAPEKEQVHRLSAAAGSRWSTHSTDKLLGPTPHMSPLAEEGVSHKGPLADVPLAPLSEKQNSHSRPPQPSHRHAPHTHPHHPLQHPDHAPAGDRFVHGHSPLVPIDAGAGGAGGNSRSRASWASSAAFPLSPSTSEGGHAGVDDDDSATAVSRGPTPNWDARSRAGSAAGLLDAELGTPYTPASPSHRSHRRAESDIRLEVEAREMRDLNVVSEFTRPGKPRLDRFLADEVERSQGAIVVACCGPASLNAVMRNSIANQIDPARVRRGDMRGSITLVAEDFEY